MTPSVCLRHLIELLLLQTAIDKMSLWERGIILTLAQLIPKGRCLKMAKAGHERQRLFP